MNRSQTKVSVMISLILRAVAMAMVVVTLILSILGTAEPNTLFTLVGIGLFTLALDALNREPLPE